MEPVVVKSGWGLLPSGKIEANTVFIIDQGKFVYAGKDNGRQPIPRGAFIFEYPKGIAVPPFINGHTHLPETLIRGLCDDEDLDIWLNQHVWRVEPHMTPEDAKVGSLLGIAEMLSTGTIGMVDQFYFSQQIAEAVNETGFKAFLAPSIFDGNAETGTVERAYAKSFSLLKKWHSFENRIFVGFGPHALYSVDIEWYEKMYEESIKYNTFIHTHLNETTKEVNQAKELWDMSPIQKLAHHNLLDRVLAAHCVVVDSVDISLLKQNKTTVLHNPQSNLKLGSGVAPIPRFLADGINVVIGTDGSASNNNLSLLEELRTAALLHKGFTKNPKTMPAFETIKMGTSNASTIFPKNSYTGKLELDSPGDLTVFDLTAASSLPIINPLSNLLYSTSDTSCQLTISNGTVLYHEGNFNTIDIEKVKADVQNSCNSMMRKANYIV